MAGDLIALSVVILPPCSCPFPCAIYSVCSLGQGPEGSFLPLYPTKPEHKASQPSEAPMAAAAVWHRFGAALAQIWCSDINGSCDLTAPDTGAAPTRAQIPATAV